MIHNSASTTILHANHNTHTYDNLWNTAFAIIWWNIKFARTTLWWDMTLARTMVLCDTILARTAILHIEHKIGTFDDLHDTRTCDILMKHDTHTCNILTKHKTRTYDKIIWWHTRLAHTTILRIKHSTDTFDNLLNTRTFDLPIEHDTRTYDILMTHNTRTYTIVMKHKTHTTAQGCTYLDKRLHGHVTTCITRT